MSGDSILTVERPLPVPTSVSKPFWEAAARKELVFQFCRRSGRFQHFPRPISMGSGKRDLEWRRVSGLGHVYAFTITERGPGPFRQVGRYVVATIELDEGVRIVSNVVNCDPAAVSVGMRVRLFWLSLSPEINYPLFEPDLDGMAGRV